MNGSCSLGGPWSSPTPESSSKVLFRNGRAVCVFDQTWSCFQQRMAQGDHFLERKVGWDVMCHSESVFVHTGRVRLRVRRAAVQVRCFQTPIEMAKDIEYEIRRRFEVVTRRGEAGTGWPTEVINEREVAVTRPGSSWNHMRGGRASGSGFA